MDKITYPEELKAEIQLAEAAGGEVVRDFTDTVAIWVFVYFLEGNKSRVYKYDIEGETLQQMDMNTVFLRASIMALGQRVP